MTDRDEVVMVTGASRGMGAETAKWLAATGCRTVLMARSSEPLKRLSHKIRRQEDATLSLSVDVGDVEQCFTAVEKALNHFGRIDALINNAGTIEPISPIAKVDVGQWHDSIRTNLMGPFHLIRAALEALRQTRGRVVNVSSGAAGTPISGWSAYCAAKAGLTHLTRVLAVEEPRITSVALRPGVVDTRMQAKIRQQGADTMAPEKFDYFNRLKSEGRLEHPSVPAQAIAWLALEAPQSWSGAFLEYDDPRIALPARKVFGDPKQSLTARTVTP